MPDTKPQIIPTPNERHLIAVYRALRLDPQDARNRLGVPIEKPERPKLRLHSPVD